MVIKLLIKYTRLRKKRPGLFVMSLKIMQPDALLLKYWKILKKWVLRTEKAV